MKILNLYAGIGGNRKFWGDGHCVTAVEFDERIAEVYQKLYPKDKVIIGDAHVYLLDHYKEFDFIWSSPPCQSHSITNFFLHAQGKRRYPDMKLYEEIFYLQHFHKGLYCVENVKSYYHPLVEPQRSGRHFFWANFEVPNVDFENQIGSMGRGSRKNNLDKLGINLSKYKLAKDFKAKLLRNCVAPAIGKAILDNAVKAYKRTNHKMNFKQVK